MKVSNLPPISLKHEHKKEVKPQPVVNKKPKQIKKNRPKANNNNNNGFEDFVFEEPNFDELPPIETKNNQRDEAFWKFYDQQIADT